MDKRPLTVSEWVESEAGREVEVIGHGIPWTDLSRRFDIMQARVAHFHAKHDFESGSGHEMGFRLALSIEELGEFASAVTKGKPVEEIAEELADQLVLIFGHALALEVDLEKAFHAKMDRVMQRKARTGHLGKRVTEYSQNKDE